MERLNLEQRHVNMLRLGEAPEGRLGDVFAEKQLAVLLQVSLLGWGGGRVEV